MDRLYYASGPRANRAEVVCFEDFESEFQSLRITGNIAKIFAPQIGAQHKPHDIFVSPACVFPKDSAIALGLIGRRFLCATKGFRRKAERSAKNRTKTLDPA